MDFLDVTYLAAVSRDQESLFRFLFLSALFPGDAIYPGAVSATYTLFVTATYCLPGASCASLSWCPFTGSFWSLPSSPNVSFLSGDTQYPQSLSDTPPKLSSCILQPSESALALPPRLATIASFFSPSSPLLGSTGHLARTRLVLFFAAHCLPVCLRQPSLPLSSYPAFYSVCHLTSKIAGIRMINCKYLLFLLPPREKEKKETFHDVTRRTLSPV